MAALSLSDGAQTVEHPRPTRLASEGDPVPWLERGCASLIVLAVVFNPLLALVNGHVMAVRPAIVAAVLAAIVVAALGTGVLGNVRVKVPWLILAWVALVLFLALSIGRSAVEYKYFGDILSIPAFICLGTQLRARTLLNVAIWLQALITAVALWELINPEGFSAVFKVAQYYIATRGFDESAFWAGNDLFVSSQRPGGRLLLASFGFHRASSIFLEPVSLGNWLVIIGILVGGFWKELSRGQAAFLIASNVVLLVACDGRLAMAVSLLLLVYLPFARRIPAWVSVFYVPMMLVVLAAATHFGWLNGEADTLTGRFKLAGESLAKVDLSQLLGVAPLDINVFDVGLLYFVQTQSIFMAVALWLMLGLAAVSHDRGATAAQHGTMLFLTLCLPISYSPFSVKTASLMWASYGLLYARAQVGRARKPEQEVRARPRARTKKAASRMLSGRNGTLPGTEAQ